MTEAKGTYACDNLVFEPRGPVVGVAHTLAVSTVSGAPSCRAAGPNAAGHEIALYFAVSTTSSTVFRRRRCDRMICVDTGRGASRAFIPGVACT